MAMWAARAFLAAAPSPAGQLRRGLPRVASKAMSYHFLIPDFVTGRVWPTTTRKLHLETGWEKCPNGAHVPKHATDLLIRTWQPGRDHSCAASSRLMIPSTDTPPSGPGQNAQFTTTHWSVVLAAGSGGSPAARQALEYDHPGQVVRPPLGA